MADDAIKEIREIRHWISEECGHDVHKVAAYYRQIEQELKASGEFRFEESHVSTVEVELPQRSRSNQRIKGDAALGV